MRHALDRVLRQYALRRAALPDRRRVARPGARRDRRGPARRAGRHRRGHPGRAGPPPPRLRARPAPALRGDELTLARRRPPRPHARLAGGHRDQEHRVVPQRQVARGDVAGAGRDRATPLTQVRPGHADLAGMQKYGFTDARDVLERASARETAARVAAGAAGQAAARRARRRGAVPRRPDGRGRGPTGARPTLADLGRGRRVAGALLRPGGRRGDDRRDQGGGQGRRLARRRRRGARLRRAGRARQPRALGPQARRPARPGGDEHPGREGRRDRRRLRGRRAAGERGPRPDPLGRRRRQLPPRHRRWPAASRAACRPASCSSCGRR